MSLCDHMLLITSFITVSTCNPYLVIVWKDHNDVTTPHTIVATVSSNLSLTCKLEGIQDVDTKLVWGRRTNELKFENAADLKELAMNNSTQILDVRDQYNPLGTDIAIKSFVPLKLTDRVEEEIICARDQFKCEDGEKCIHKSATCDSEFDCTDHSDERWPRCPCVGGILCDDECIPIKWCCDRNTDLDCLIPKRHSCCPPLAVGPDNESYGKIDKNYGKDYIEPTFDYVPVLGIVVVGALAFLVPCVVIYYGIKLCSICKANDEPPEYNEVLANGIPVPIIRTEGNDNTMMLTALMNTARMNNSGEYLDLPPTYDDSTRNSPQSSFHNSLEDIPKTVVNDCSSPPSYNEALANLTSSVPSSLNEAGATSDFLEVRTSRNRTSL